MFLPLPVILVDKNLSTTGKILGMAGPGTVQMAVGNAVEHVIFGKALNMTALSILVALVIWSAM